MDIIEAPSPNFGERRGSGPVDILLLHYTGMPSAEGALAWLRDPRSTVSSHYFVFEDGRVAQLVDEAGRAHHAGVSNWHGETDINSRSIGIEIANPGHEYGYVPFPDPQIVALIELCHGILARNPIPPERVLAHSDVAPLRKADPGEYFPWKRLYEAGIGHYVPPVPLREGPVLSVGDIGPEVVRLKDRFRKYGYGLFEADEFDVGMAGVVTAFQRHFRPERIDGVADVSTCETLEKLISALPIAAK